MNHVGDLLAQRRRRGRLTVGARHHRQFGVGVGQFAQAGDHLVEHRQHHLITRGLEHQRVREIVDVFRRAGKVDEFGNAHHFGVIGQLFFDPVFERLDVVIGRLFDVLDLGCLGRAEIGKQPVERRKGRRRKRRNLGKMRLLRQRLEPFDLDLQAAANQPVFGKLRAYWVSKRCSPSRVLQTSMPCCTNH